MSKSVHKNSLAKNVNHFLQESQKFFIPRPHNMYYMPHPVSWWCMGQRLETPDFLKKMKSKLSITLFTSQPLWITNFWTKSLTTIRNTNYKWWCQWKMLFHFPTHGVRRIQSDILIQMQQTKPLSRETVSPFCANYRYSMFTYKHWYT